MEYDELLERAHKALPETALTKTERFEVENVKGHLQGNKTVISNFLQITTQINRPREHILKFILKELAAPGEIRNGLLVLGTKIPASRINEKIRAYIVKFVMCPECGKPDTQLVKEGSITFKKCMACGAKAAVKMI